MLQYAHAHGDSVFSGGRRRQYRPCVIMIVVDCRYVTTICNDAASEHLFFEHDLLVFPRTRIARRAHAYRWGRGGDTISPFVYTAAGVVESGKRRPRASDRNNPFHREGGEGTDLTSKARVKNGSDTGRSSSARINDTSAA